MTLQEAFSPIELDISHLIIFGCPIDINVSKEKRTKLKPSRKKCTFFGYNKSSKMYIIYILGQKQIEINRDVSFDEDAACNKSKGSNIKIS